MVSVYKTWESSYDGGTTLVTCCPHPIISYSKCVHVVPQSLSLSLSIYEFFYEVSVSLLSQESGWDWVLVIPTDPRDSNKPTFQPHFVSLPFFLCPIPIPNFLVALSFSQIQLPIFVFNSLDSPPPERYPFQASHPYSTFRLTPHVPNSTVDTILFFFIPFRFL